MSAELTCAKERLALLAKVRGNIGPDKWLIEVLQLIIQHLEAEEERQSHIFSERA